MRYVRLTNATRSVVLSDNCGVADNFVTRVRGLLGRTSLREGEGLFITPCPSIHMFGMKFALDVIFVTPENVVTDWVENILPGKVYVAKAHCGKPQSAIELPVGTIPRSGTQYGDQLVCEDIDGSTTR